LVLNTFSDPYVAFAFWAGITALGLTLLMALVIVYLRLKLRKNQRLEAAFMALWRPILLEAVSVSEPPLLPALHPWERLFFLKLWNYLQESLRGSANDRLNELARSLQCDIAARSFLKKGKRAERLLAILTLGHLRDRASWEGLAAQATSPDSVASIHAARALIKIDSLRATEYLLPLMLERIDWDIAYVVSFLGEARQTFGLQLDKSILNMNKQHWPRALQLADALNLQLPLKSMLFILDNCQSVDALVAALHLSPEPELLPTVRSYLQHPDWRVRVEVARFLGRFGDSSDIASLQLLLHDLQWWARYQAAQALASMPFFGLEELKALRAQTHDVLASDMLDHVLAEHNTVPT